MANDKLQLGVVMDPIGGINPSKARPLYRARSHRHGQFR